MRLTSTAHVVRCALAVVLCTGISSAAGPPIIDYLEIQTLTRHQRVSIHGHNLDQSGQVFIAGIPAFVIPIPGTNAVKMNAYVPANTPFGFCDVVVATAAGTSNPLTLEVVPRRPEGRNLWRFFMNNQIMLHRPAVGSDGTIYARSQAGDLIGITPQGEMKWFLQLGGDLTPQVAIGPDDTIYTADGGSTIYAVNPGDGSIRWTYTDPLTNQGVLAGPNVGPDGNIYVVTHLPGTGIFSLSPTGNRRWTGPDNPYFPIAQKGQEIVFSDSQLFFCQNGRYDSFDLSGNHVFRNFTVTQYSDDSPQPAVGPNGDNYIEYWSLLTSYDQQGSENWTAFSPPGSYLRDPDVGPDGTIYVMRNVFNTFHALNPDGSTRWTYNHPVTLLNPVMDPTGETIVIGGGGSGTAFFLGIDKGGNPKWQVDMPLEPLTPYETVRAFPQGRARFTPDGSVAYVMASSTSNSGGHSYLYALQVGPHVDVGHGLAGAGSPRLSASGTLEGGTPFDLSIEDAPPGATVFLIAGNQALAAPFKGGILLPRPETIEPVTVDALGQHLMHLTWPVGIAPEQTFYIQGWIPDPAGPHGFSATNGLSLITP